MIPTEVGARSVVHGGGDASVLSTRKHAAPRAAIVVAATTTIKDHPVSGSPAIACARPAARLTLMMLSIRAETIQISMVRAMPAAIASRSPGLITRTHALSATSGART